LKPYYVPSPFLQFHASLSLVFRWSLFSFDIAAYLILSLSLFFLFSCSAGRHSGNSTCQNKWRWHGEEWIKNQSIVPVSTVFVTAISRLLIALNVCVYASLRRSQSGESFTTEASRTSTHQVHTVGCIINKRGSNIQFKDKSADKPVLFLAAVTCVWYFETHPDSSKTVDPSTWKRARGEVSDSTIIMP